MNTVLNLHEIPEFFIFFGFRALFDRYVSYFMYVPSKSERKNRTKNNMSRAEIF